MGMDDGGARNELLTEKMQRAPGPPPLAPGSRVGKFRINRLIGRGGMGEVYAARDMELGRRVALKFIRLAHGAEASLEAVATARVTHPNIVIIHGTGHHEGRVYLVLELVEGRSLRERLKHESIPPTEVIRIAAAMADALHAAHDAGVVHRDLKPENILLGNDGRPRLVDFGVAELVRGRPAAALAVSPGTSAETTQDEEELTRRDAHGSDTITGTPAYMAPEQWEQEAGPAADTWALGVVLYECLCGKRPFTETQPVLLYEAIRRDEPVNMGPLSGVDPALRALVADCLAKDPVRRPRASEVRDRLRVLSGQAAQASGSAPPFRGLMPFNEWHTAYFHGRDAEIDDLVERLRTGPVTGVAGPSGAGKSSLVHAGLVPRLRASGQWVVITLRPGAHPFDALWTSLGTSDSALRARLQQPEVLGMTLRARAEESHARILLVVDQLEEVVTLVSAETERRAWLASLAHAATEAAEPVRVVFTLRDDFLGRVADASEPHDLLRQLMFLRAPGPAMLERALRAPVEHAGYSWEDADLPRAMAAEVAGETAALPLLQVAAQLMWERRDESRRLLTRSAYEAAGGVVGALAHHADSTMDGMHPRMAAAARVLMLRLVTPEGTRRRLATAAALEGLGDDGPAVLERLRAARLVLVERSEGTEDVELVHEALIRRWQRLARWVDEGRAAREELAEAQRAAARWMAHRRSAEQLWPGPRAEEARALAARANVPLDPPVHQFLHESSRELLRTRRERAMLRGASLLALVAVALTASVAAVFMARKEEEARRQQGIAQVQRADAEREGARAALALGRLAEARAKLRTSVEILDTLDARSLYAELARQPHVASVRVGGALYDLGVSPAGDEVIAATQSGALQRVRLDGRDRGSLAECGDQCISAAWSLDGSEVYSGAWDGWVRAVKVASREGRPLVQHPDAVMRIVAGRDGRVVSTSRDGTAFLLTPGSTAPPRSLPARGRVAAFHPAGELVALGDSEGNITLVRVSEGGVIGSSHGHAGPVRALAFSADGSLLASSGQDATVAWSVPALEKRMVTRGQAGEVTTATISPSGRHIYEGRSGFVHAWDVAKDRLVGVLSAGGKVMDLEVTRDEHILWGAASGPESRVQAWDLRVPLEAPGAAGARAPVYGLAASSDGRFVVAGGGGATGRRALVYDARTAEVVHELVDPATSDLVRVARFSPDGQQVVAVGGTSFTTVWRAPAGTVEQHLPGHARNGRDAAFSGDGRLLATVGEDGITRIFDTATWTEVGHLQGDPLRAVALDTHGTQLAVAGEARVIDVWTGPTWRLRQRLEGHSGLVDSLAFTPDEMGLVSAGNDGDVRAWDLRTGKGRLVGHASGRLYALVVSPDGKRVYTASSAGLAESWDLADSTRTTVGWHPAEVNRVALSPDGAHLFTSSDDGSVMAWHAAGGGAAWFGGGILDRPARVLSHRGWSALETEVGELPRRGEDEVLVAYADGETRCVLDASGSLRVSVGGGLHVTPVGHVRVVAAVDGACLVLQGTTLLVVTPGAPPRKLLEPVANVGGGHGAAAVSGTLVHRVGRGGTLENALEAGAGVTAAAWGADGTFAGFKDGALRRVGSAEPWNGPTRAEVTVVATGTRGLLAAGHADGTVALWHAGTARFLEARALHGAVKHLAFTSGGLAAQSARGEAILVDLGPYEDDECSFRARVARAAPFRWHNGGPVPAEAPEPCSPR